MISQLQQIRKLLLLFMLLLFLSGVTAIPLDAELSFLLPYVPPASALHAWLLKVLTAYREVKEQYPFLLYGYDWLTFAHWVLALFFIGPYIDPVRNIWVIQAGMMACVLVLPLAFIAGSARGIPPGWQLIDCSFGVFGFIPLWICYRKTKQIILNTNNQNGNIYSKCMV